MPADQGGCELRIGPQPLARIALPLPIARRDDAGANVGRAFTWRARGEHVGRKRRHLDREVHAVAQRAR